MTLLQQSSGAGQGAAAAPEAASQPPKVRGFVIDRQDGRPQLPGSLHTNRLLSQWLDFSTEGVVRAFMGKVELGQGILTAIALIAAEELGVAFEQIRIVPASTLAGPDEGMTSSSLSIQDCGGAMRHVCAEVRSIAVAKAAELAKVRAADIRVVDGSLQGPGGEVLGTYWSLLTAQDLTAEYRGLAAPKPPAARTLLGSARPARIDLPDKVFGVARFIHDLRLEGMCHGRVVRPPSPTAQLIDIPADALARISGLARVVVDGRFVGLIAQTERDAAAAADQLRDATIWSEQAVLPEQSQLAAFLRTAPSSRSVTFQQGDALDAAPADATQHSASYFKPYLAHGSIGPSCAIACWNGERLRVYSHSQGIQNLRDDIVVALAQGPMPVARENIDVHHVEGSGCYGHNGADDVAFDAVLLAMAVPGQPVRVQWTRADELGCAPFGPAHAVALRACTDAAGRLTHWHNELWANGYSSRPGRATTPTLLAAAHRQCGTPAPIAINPPVAAGGGAERNAVPAYGVPNVSVVTHKLMVMPLRTSAMRALGAFANVFALESFIDEVAHAVGMDAVEYRRMHLHEPRTLAVIDAVLAHAQWWTDKPAAGSGIGHGFAWARYKNTGSWCAVAARIEVGESVRVLDLDLAVDVGQVVDLDGVINQIEGGALQSVSWSLKEQVGFDTTRVTTTGWDTYPILRFSEIPRVRVTVLDRPDQPSLGAGEAAQGPVAAALGNAVFHALGVRVRSLPLDRNNILAAMEAS